MKKNYLFVLPLLLIGCGITISCSKANTKLSEKIIESIEKKTIEKFSDKDTDAIEKTYNFKDFSEIKIKNSCHVVYTQDKEYTIKAVASPNNLSKLKLTQEGDEIIVDENRIKKETTYTIYISSPILHKVDVEGVVFFETTNEIHQPLMEWDLEGVCTFNCIYPFIVNQFELDIDGVANLKNLQINAQECNLDIEGVAKGKIDIEGGYCKFTTEGVCNIDAQVECDELYTHNEGVCQINFSGHANTFIKKGKKLGKINTTHLTINP